ncbi:MAG TPA: hypothetical protein VFR37_11080 [Longimicrobium sp.]|nr:hypothetical protein [Longimicrobium sp.]
MRTVRIPHPSRSTLAAGALLAACASPSGPPTDSDEWLRAVAPGVVLEYRAEDAQAAPAMLERIAGGRTVAAAFLGLAYTRDVTVRVHPTGDSFAEEWRRVTGAAPQCWMIANGTAAGVVMLSPRVWSTAACGHDGTNAAYVQGVTTHELVHVLQHQHNADPVRLQREAEWFEEGLAVLAAGQLDAPARAAVRQRVQAGFAPATLAEAWSGTPIPYAVGGSLVHYVDSVHGRAALHGLLAETTAAGLLARLDVSEAAFLDGWRAFAAAY